MLKPIKGKEEENNGNRGKQIKEGERIFQQFDANCDGVLKRRDLVVAVNPKVERVKRRKSVRRHSVSS